MIQIDGAQGEGGGQVLRSALTLAALTGQATRITNIRAGRSKPGLRAQHITAVEAIATITNAELHGAKMGSTELEFHPGSARPGSYRFDIRTAGAASLVMQTIFLPLSTASENSTVAITGGTHVPWSPCFHYLDWLWLPTLNHAGFNAKLTLKRAGFFPKGGGRIQALIRPAENITSLQWTERGQLLQIRGLSAVANLPASIAERQRKRALRRLKGRSRVDIKEMSLRASSPGTFLLLFAEFEFARCCYFALGRKGKPAEQVADDAVNELEAYLATDAAMDEYLADQVLLPLAFATGPSHFSTARVTDHLVTNAAVIQAFLPTQIDIQGSLGEPGLVTVTPERVFP